MVPSLGSAHECAGSIGVKERLTPRVWVSAGVVVLAVIAAALLINTSDETLPATVGSPPVAIDDMARLAADSMPITIAVTRNDTDPDGDLDPLAVVVTKVPGSGATKVNLDGTVMYSPAGDFPGTDTFSYEVCDGSGLCDVGTVTVLPREVVASGETVRFAVFGDYGDGAAPGSLAVSQMVAGLAPDFIVTTGDNSYDNADYEANVGQYYADFIGGYEGAHGQGSPVNRFFPSLGDHEYSDGGVEAYLDFFTLPGEGVSSTNTSGNERYYDFIMGPVHFFVLNVQPLEPDGANRFSPQANWLQTQLAESSSPWRMVVSPVPPYSSGENHGSDRRVQWPYDIWGGDVVLSGDDHIYERIQHHGTTYIVSGLGGRSMYALAAPVDGSEVRFNEDFGVLMVEACDTRVELEFHTLTRGVIDSYSLGEPQCSANYDGGLG